MFDTVVWSQLGPWGLVSIFVMLIAWGRLIPRWTHKERLKDRDDQITLLKAMVDKRDEQFDKLVAQGEVTVRLIEDLKAAGRPAGTRTGPT